MIASSDARTIEIEFVAWSPQGASRLPVRSDGPWNRCAQRSSVQPRQTACSGPAAGAAASESLRDAMAASLPQFGLQCVSNFLSVGSVCAEVARPA